MSPGQHSFKKQLIDYVFEGSVTEDMPLGRMRCFFLSFTNEERKFLPRWAKMTGSISIKSAGRLTINQILKNANHTECVAKRPCTQLVNFCRCEIKVGRTIIRITWLPFKKKNYYIAFHNVCEEFLQPPLRLSLNAALTQKLDAFFKT